MTKREKVIESLNKALTRVGYGDIDNVTLSEVEEAIESAIALLMEQEPVKPIMRGGFYLAECGKCNEVISLYCIYCPHCGRKVKWNGD